MDVLKEFQAAIGIEFAKKLEDFEEQQKLPLDERIAKGVTMTNLRVQMDFYDGPFIIKKELITTQYTNDAAIDFIID